MIFREHSIIMTDIKTHSKIRIVSQLKLSFNEEILRRPESVSSQIKAILTDTKYKDVIDVAHLAQMCLGSSATNDYLEKIGAEAIGAKHLTAKLGPDGELHGKGLEVKPCKKSPGSAGVGVVNDDTPMKLLDTHTKYEMIVFLNAKEDGSRVNWAVCVPYKYFEPSRYLQIVKKLKLVDDPTWTWGSVLPGDGAERTKCLEALVAKHKEGQYVRSSSLSLTVLKDVPKNEVVFWKHPEIDKKKLNKALQAFF
jgi:hypothetical protein